MVVSIFRPHLSGQAIDFYISSFDPQLANMNPASLASIFPSLTIKIPMLIILQPGQDPMGPIQDFLLEMAMGVLYHKKGLNYQHGTGTKLDRLKCY